ncbi:hypothetical protein [Halomonas caseinilytica]|uniref:hypothetical protein n=1 Tax=Halomonas caseinilytica TaxID=438744 RepID=UPI000AC187DF|nr:hypothetical protein [Halomonas caseinilytica]
MEWLAFVIAALGCAYLPGPAMLYTPAQRLGGGLLASLGAHGLTQVYRQGVS